MNDEIKLPRFELGNPGFERDALLDVALSGRKTATSSLLREWQEEDTLLPEPGDLQIMINSAGDEVARVIITKVEVRKLGEVDDAIANAEGEGFKNTSQWRKAHEQIWLGDIYNPAVKGWQLPDNTKIVIEYFKLAE